MGMDSALLTECDLREERWGRDPLFVFMLLYLLPGFSRPLHSLYLMPGVFPGLSSRETEARSSGLQAVCRTLDGPLGPRVSTGTGSEAGGDR